MAVLSPTIRVKRGDVRGNVVWIQLPDLSTFEKTFLSADEAAAQTTLSVESSVNWSANDYIVIGEPGHEHTEIERISSATGNVLTLASATSFAHPRGTIIRFIPFDQIVVEDDTETTFTGANTSQIAIHADALETMHIDTDGTATTYYRAKFYNSNTGGESQYSDYVIATGFADNTVFSVKKRGLESVGEKLGNYDWLTHEWCNEVLWEGRRELESKLKRWSFRKKYDTDVGNVVSGEYILSYPSDLRGSYASKNILAIRIGKDGTDLERISKKEMNQYYEGVAHTTLASDAATSDTTITLTLSGDFDESGSITVGGSSSLDEVDYTSNAESTGILSGVTGIAAAGHSSGVDIWQSASFGLPQRYCVTDDGIIFDQPFDDNYYLENIYMDYFCNLTALDSDADTFDEPDHDMFVNYLAFRIKKRREAGNFSLEDDDYQQWLLRSQTLTARETSEEKIEMVPDIAELDTE